MKVAATVPLGVAERCSAIGKLVDELKPITNPNMSSDLTVAAALARAAIAGASDEHLTKTWSLLFRGKTVFSLPRGDVLRRTLLSHMIHHRAQLGVYLRLNDIPVPALYGPSADEPLSQTE